VRGGVAGRAPPGTKGGAAGAPYGSAAGGVNGGTAGGGVNSGKPEVGEGGVAVAAAEARSMDSGLDLGPPCTSEARGLGAAGAAGRCAGGTDDARWPELLKGAGSQPSCACGVERERACDADSEAEAPARGEPVTGVVWPVGAGMGITPPQTEQRALTPTVGTLAGSTRKIERQSGQLTFIHPLQSSAHLGKRAAVPVA